MRRSVRMIMVSVLMVLSLMMVVSFSYGIDLPDIKIVGPKVQPRTGPTDPSKIRMVDMCNVTIAGLKKYFDSPNLKKFEIQYNIPTTCNKAYFIKAYLPNKGSQNTIFTVTPAGIPGGIPKGEHFFESSSIFEVKYNGTQPITTNSMEIEIYNDGGQIMASYISNSAFDWGEGCAVQIFKESNPTPGGVLLQVGYYIPASWPGTYYIHGAIPNSTNRNQNLFDKPAGYTTNGVPKGQHNTAENIFVDIGYKYGSPPITTSTVEFLVTDSPSGGKVYCSALFNYIHSWVAQ
jgi:hypothetical protein